MDTIVPVLSSGAIVATVLQLLKNSPLVPWLSRDSGKLNAAISIAAAGLTTLGLSYNTSFDATTGAFTLGFSGTLGGVFTGIAHWMGQWTAQHAFYKGFIAPAEILGEMRTLQQKLAGVPMPQDKAPQHDE